MSDRSHIAAQMMALLPREGHTLGSLAVALGVPLVLMRRVAGGDTHVAFEEFRKIRQWVEGRRPALTTAKPEQKRGPKPAAEAQPAVGPYLRTPQEAHIERSQPRHMNIATLARDLDALRNEITSLRELVQHHIGAHQ